MEKRILMKVRSSPRTPKGYRLATLQEITDNRHEISSREIIKDSEKCRVLDGIVDAKGEVSYRRDHELEGWSIMPNMLIITQSPHLSGKGSALLRRHLYDGVIIAERRRETALQSACDMGDIEVIYWLRSLPSNLARMIKCFERTTASGLYATDSSIVCKMLLDKTRQIEEAEWETCLQYACSCIKKDADYAISIVEIVLEVCREQGRMDIVDAQIQRMVESSNTKEENLGILAKLLSVSTQPIENIIKGHFQMFLTEACRRGYVSLLAALLRLPDAVQGEIKDEVDDDQKTLLHYAAEWGHGDEVHGDEVFWALFEKLGTPDAYQKKLDLQGKSVLHFASLAGKDEICKRLIFEFKWEARCKDNLKQNILHYAARGTDGFKIVTSLACEDKNLIKDLLSSKNDVGQTPLHAVAFYHNYDMFCSFARLPGILDLKETDNGGRTALHIAASEGYQDLVDDLLLMGSDPLQERDLSGRTALHYAMINAKGKETARALAETLLDKCKSKEKKALLLGVSASGIGTAEETRGVDPDVKKYLIGERKKTKQEGKEVNLLQEAAKAGNARLAWEFLVRGGNASQIKQMPEMIRKQIETYMEQGIERPTLVDTLGRDALAECVAEHFLNSHIISPINVSISGGSGMGKTSLMQQIKAYLQITSSQLAIPYLWMYEELFGKSVSLSQKGKTMLRQIEIGVYKLMEKKEDFHPEENKQEEKALIYFLENYRQEDEAVYKTLACMDFAQLLKNNQDDSNYAFQGQSLGAAPRVLTVDFNAGMYRGNYEAWAGLALQITRAIEDSMTRAQKLSTRWRNATRNNFLLKFILPGLLLIFLAGWVAWAAWLLLDRTHNGSLQGLKYGSIPATIIAIVWGVVSSAASIFKKVSTQMSEYFKVPDYSKHLSYQEQVISDIKFLKGEIGKRPLTAFSLLTGERWNNWFGLWKDNIKGTSIPKYGSAPQSKLQIIAFVDDLDHCENEAIYKVLWSINLVFRECAINFVLGVDKTTIQTALRNSMASQGENSADDFINKNIQLPVNLSDPETNIWKEFLQRELGCKLSSKEDAERNHVVEIATEGHVPANEEKEAEATEEREDNREETDIEDGSILSQYEGCFMSSCRLLRQRDIRAFFHKIRLWIKTIIHILYAFACNDRNEIVVQGRDCQTVGVPRRDWHDHSNLWNSRVLSARMLELRGSLMLTYSDEEIKIFDKLSDLAAGGIQKFPREWKCCIKYHKFARNVILKKAKKYKKINLSQDWQVEFVVWTFVCMKWKREMNTLIKHWHKLVTSPDIVTSSDIVSLKMVVGAYKAQRWPEGDKKEWIKLTEALNKIQGIQKNWAQGFNEFEIKCRPMELQEGLEFKYQTTQSRVDAEEEERELWDNLHTCLDKIHDVSFKNLQIFQEFRFHCDAKNLKTDFAEKNGTTQST